MRKSWLLAAAASVAVGLPAFSQVAPARPTPEQLAKTYEEDQLSLEKCGVPRNAGDDYRPAPMYPDQTRAPRITRNQAFKIETVATGLQNAWGMAFLPSGNMLVTIRGSGLKVVTPGGAVSDTLPGTPTIRNQVQLFGMHDVLLDRDFATNRTIYLAFISTPGLAQAAPAGQAAPAPAGQPATPPPTPVGYIASARLSADEKSITDFKVLKEGAFFPRRIVQHKDGTLLAVTADVQTPYVSAQSLKSANGKVLRINTDGSIPKDNPFVGNADADPAVYALGLRDTQGMAFHPQTGDLWLIENEPRGGDELNVVKAGKNYGFPLISYGRDNNGNLLNGGLTKQDGLEQPVHFWTPSVAFSGLAFYTGDKLPAWKGSVFAGGLSGQQLVRLELNAQGRVIGEEKLLRDQCKRIRDVRQGPDGHLYVLTDAASGEIWRLAPG
jgi:glucose/arabinose dehydrogenase